jgi:hypothetical protein
VTDLPPELPPVPKVPLPGETLEQYRLRVVESKVDVADAKLDIITNWTALSARPPRKANRRVGFASRLSAA